MALLRPRSPLLLRRLREQLTSPPAPSSTASWSYELLDCHFQGYSRRRWYSKIELEKLHREDDGPKSWLHKYWPFIPPAALFLGLVTFIHYNDERRAISKDVPQTAASARTNSNRPAIGGPFELYDTEGKLVTQESLSGSWSLIYFGYTSCPDVGPKEAYKMAEATELLDSKYKLKIKPVFITIDPQRDTPAQLKTYLGEFSSKIVGLTGPIAAVRQVAQEYRVFFKKVDEIGQDYLVESSHHAFLVDPNLEMARVFGVEYDSLQLADAVYAEIKKGK